ncbi:MAG TPA: hypothetical protein VH437_19220 [Terriglobales bacterium]|jgi:hypothetical protein
MSRAALVSLLIFSVFPAAIAKEKKQQVLPDYVLKAETVAVVIHPDAGEPVNNPMANRNAQENVEKALTQWGRFKVVMNAQTADLVISVQKGHASGPAVRNSPTDNRPVIIQPGDSSIRLGGQGGRPPDLTRPSPGVPSPEPRMDTEIGTADDTFAVYRGGTEFPLDSAPVWRYIAKKALDGPQVSAVEQFRKLVAESEKQNQKKP